MYVPGMFIQFLTDLKDASKNFNLSMQDMLELAPYEFNLIKLLLARDVQEESERI